MWLSFRATAILGQIPLYCSQNNVSLLGMRPSGHRSLTRKKTLPMSRDEDTTQHLPILTLVLLPRIRNAICLSFTRFAFHVCEFAPNVKDFAKNFYHWKTGNSKCLTLPDETKQCTWTQGKLCFFFIHEKRKWYMWSGKLKFSHLEIKWL